MRYNSKSVWLFLFIAGIGIILFFLSFDYLTGNGNDGFGPVQQGGVLFGFFLALVAGNYFYPVLLKFFFIFIYAVGIFLLSLNVYGEFVSLRNPKIYEGVSSQGIYRIPERYVGNGQDQLEKAANETYQKYAYRLTKRIFDLTVHLWNDSIDASEYNHQVPPHENYLLWGLSYLEPNVYRYYELCDPYKAIERGVMICSQDTQALVSLWKSQTGLAARNMVLDGHVVAEVQIEPDSDIWWVLDADYGVVLEKDIATLETQPEFIIEKYMSAGYSREIAQDVAAIYGKEGNYVTANKGICRREENLYKAKWYIPLILLGISTLYFAGAWSVKKIVHPTSPR